MAKQLGPPPAAPPSYAQAVGGVAPSSPFIPNHTFYRDSTILTTVVPLGPDSTHMICPNCRAEVDTTTKSEPGFVAYLLGILLCLVCPCGCCFIPCCVDTCLDVHHHCPSCKTYLGRYKR